jgi:hypothetical protein
MATFTDGTSKPVVQFGLEEMGLEHMTGPAPYDNGDFIVVDTVAHGLEWTVLRVQEDGTVSPMRVVPLDKYEAIRVADEFKEALQHQMP